MLKSNVKIYHSKTGYIFNVPIVKVLNNLNKNASA